MISTEIVWTNAQRFDSSIHTALYNKLEEMELEGKTNGHISLSALPNQTWLATREWNSLSDAQEWIDFVLGFDPVSATIAS